VRENLSHRSNIPRSKGQDSTHALNLKAMIKNKKKKKNKSKLKTKNNKIPPETVFEEHNIIDVTRRHNLVHENHASASEKHTLVCETPKYQNGNPEETTKKHCYQGEKDEEGTGEEKKNNESILLSGVFFPFSLTFLVAHTMQNSLYHNH
jgi:hypothetical protein